MAAYPGNTTPQNSDDQQLTLKKILLALIGGGPGGGVPVVPSGSGTNTTPKIVNATAGQTVTIPAGAASVGVLLSTGTGTFGGTAMVVGQPYNFANPVVATAVIFANPGTGIVTYQS